MTWPIRGLAPTTALVLTLALAGCATDDAQDPAPSEPTIVQCALGSWHDESFAPLPTSSELVVGFQGFVWIDLGFAIAPASAPALPAAETLATVRIGYQLQGEALRSTIVTTRMQADGSAAVRLLLAPADAKLLAGRTLAFAARVDVAALRCDLQADLALVDADPCIHVDDERNCGAGAAP